MQEDVPVQLLPSQQELVDQSTNFIEEGYGPKVVHLEGLSGAGKSTIAKSIAASLKKRLLYTSFSPPSKWDGNSGSIHIYGSSTQYNEDAYPEIPYSQRPELPEEVRDDLLLIEPEHLGAKDLRKLVGAVGKQVAGVIILDQLSTEKTRSNKDRGLRLTVVPLSDEEAQQLISNSGRNLEAETIEQMIKYGFGQPRLLEIMTNLPEITEADLKSVSKQYLKTLAPHVSSYAMATGKTQEAQLQGAGNLLLAANPDLDKEIFLSVSRFKNTDRLTPEQLKAYPKLAAWLDYINFHDIRHPLPKDEQTLQNYEAFLNGKGVGGMTTGVNIFMPKLTEEHLDDLGILQKDIRDRSYYSRPSRVSNYIPQNKENRWSTFHVPGHKNRFLYNLSEDKENNIFKDDRVVKRDDPQRIIAGESSEDIWIPIGNLESLAKRYDHNVDFDSALWSTFSHYGDINAEVAGGYALETYFQGEGIPYFVRLSAMGTFYYDPEKEKLEKVKPQKETA